jgi:hypothetical protein
VGDKSPKAKERNLKQKDSARAGDAAAAKAKQDAQSRILQPAAKNRK